MAEVNVKFADYESGAEVRRILREQCDNVRRLIAFHVQGDNIDGAKRCAEELTRVEAALEAVREGLKQSHE